MTEQRLGVMQKPEPAQAITETGGEEEESKKETNFKFELQTIKLSDVIGMKRSKALLYSFMEQPLKKPKDYDELDVKKSCGVILYGPPGTGKSFISKAVNGTLELPMCYVTPTSVMSKYVGDSAAHVHQLFEEAYKQMPCTIFIDEADVLLQNRDSISSEGGSSELKQAVSQMLVETSKVHDTKGSHIYMLAATNEPWSIDPAHKRSGRFKYIVYIPAPNFWERRLLFKKYLGKENLNRPEKYGTVNYSILALATIRYSPADIEEICKVAKVNAMKKAKIFITTRTVQKALWSHEAGRSSMDGWYVSMAVKYLPGRKSFWKSLISQAYKKAEMPKTKFDKADLEIYEDLIKDVNSYMKWKIPRKIARILGKGIPNYW